MGNKNMMEIITRTEAMTFLSKNQSYRRGLLWNGSGFTPNIRRNLPRHSRGPGLRWQGLLRMWRTGMAEKPPLANVPFATSMRMENYSRSTRVEPIFSNKFRRKDWTLSMKIPNGALFGCFRPRAHWNIKPGGKTCRILCGKQYGDSTGLDGNSQDCYPFEIYSTLFKLLFKK